MKKLVFFFSLFGFYSVYSQPTKIHSILPYWSFDILEGFTDSALQKTYFNDYELDSVIYKSLVIQNYDPSQKVKIALSYDEVNWNEFYINPKVTVVFNNYKQQNSVNSPLTYHIRIFHTKANGVEKSKEYRVEDERCIVIGWNKSRKVWDAWFVECKYP